MNKIEDNLIPRKPEAEKKHQEFLGKCKDALARRRKVEELVKEAKWRMSEYGSEVMALVQKGELSKLAELTDKATLYVLSINDLALIDRDAYPLKGDTLLAPVIPLAEALKEVKDG